MKLLKMEKVRDGKFLKNYELTYLNKAGREKKYEIVSRRELSSPADLGAKPSGVSIIAVCQGRLLLLQEFRMGINKTIYNLCAGMLEDGETIEECVQRELYEETGLLVRRIWAILPPSYAAVAISDTTTYIAIVDAEGEMADHTSENEQIEAQFYTREEVSNLLQTEEFSSRAQLAAYFFSRGCLNSMLRITDSLTAKQLYDLKKLYRCSFPASEKKPFRLIRRKQREGSSEILGLLDQDGQLVGEIITLLWQDLLLVDYLAIVEDARSRGYGAQALQLLRERHKDKRLLLEIETPDIPCKNLQERIRRKRFYESCGFDSMDYHILLFGVEMEIMTYQCKVSFEEYHGIFTGIYGDIFARNIVLL